MKTKLFTLLIVLVLVGVGGAFLWVRQNSAKAAVPTTSTAKAERSNLRITVSSTGRVASNLDVDIKCKASGQIVELPFDVSDTVKKGQLLVRLDPIDEQREVSQCQATVDAAQARLASAAQNLIIAQQTVVTNRGRAEAALQSAEAKAQDCAAKAARMKDLWQQKLASVEDHDTAQTAAVQAAGDLATARVQIEELKTQEQALELRRQDIALAKAQLASDQVSLDNAKQRLTDTTVLAPMDGVVAVRGVQIGLIISSGITNVGGGTTVLTLSDLSHVFVLAAVDESDVGRVQTGQTVRITADGFPGARFEGKVVRIATRGVNASNVVTFEVKIEVVSDNKDLLKPEMTANIDIVVAQKQGALCVPTTAISRRKEDGQSVVQVVKADGTNEERVVALGLNDGLRYEVTAGVEEGDTVTVRKTDPTSRWQPNPAMRQRMMMGGR